MHIPSIGENIRLVEDFILGIHDEVHFSESVLDRIMISVTEATNNAILHGNKSIAEKEVHVTCTCFDDHTVFTVEDEGGGFSPENVPDPLEEANLLKEGGRGILIIRSMID